mgnify:CR=1 FL=1
MKGILAVFIFVVPFFCQADTALVYHKEYYNNHVLKAEGWLQDGVKTKYWKFYRPDGKLKSEGHYKLGNKSDYWFFYRSNGKKLKEGSYSENLMVEWWSFYSKEGEITEKCQFAKGVKNGFRVVYVNEKPKMVEKFKDDVKTDEWTSYTGFIMENGDLLLDE